MVFNENESSYLIKDAAMLFPRNWIVIIHGSRVKLIEIVLVSRVHHRIALFLLCILGIPAKHNVVADVMEVAIGELLFLLRPIYIKHL